jgi:enamine deaminase RidA (YjgF/YER057c/UK114 family)
LVGLPAIGQSVYLNSGRLFSVEDLVRTVIYVTATDDAESVGRAHREVFGGVRPASTMVQVVALVRPEMRVEIEAYAVIDAAA